MAVSLQDQLIQYNCSIGNPLSRQSQIDIRVVLQPLRELIGNEGSFSINFTVSSVNQEDPATVEDGSNYATANLPVEARARITIDDG